MNNTTKLGARKLIWQKLKENHDNIINRYLSGESSRKIGESIGIEKMTICNYLKKNKIKMRTGCRGNKKKMDDNYFEVLDTKEKAYWLGWLMSDGCVCKNSIMLGLQERDREILEKFKKSLKSEMEIKTYRYMRRETGKMRNPLCVFSFCCKKMAEDLLKYGMKPAKSLTLEFPKINELLIPSFLRGYFEGDGSIGMHAPSKKGSPNKFRFSVLSTKEFIFDMIRYFQQYDIQLRYHWPEKYKKINMYVVGTANKNSIIKILDILYEDCGDLILSRKHKTYLEMKEYLRLNPSKTEFISKKMLEKTLLV